MKWLKDIATGIISPVTGYFTNRDNNKTEVKKQHVQRIMNAEDKEGELATILSEGMRYSWKDEYWTIVLSIPAMACFHPDLVVHVEAGFEALKTMPEFYQYWLAVAILTSFGMRLKR